MKKLLLFFLLLTIFSCSSTSKKNAAIADTLLDLKNSKSNQSVPADTVKPVQTKIEKPEKEVTDQKEVMDQKEVTDQYEDDFNQKAIVYRSDSSLNIFENIRADYKIFGYQAPDTNSKKLLLVSVFTKDVEGNPYNCTYGSYYGSAAMQPVHMKYVKIKGAFVEANLIKDKELLTPVFFLKSCVEFKD